MTHVIGMAKSCLDSRGSKGRNLELDFQRLMAAVKEIRACNTQAVGILLVLNETVQRRADGWKQKYNLTDEIEVVLAPITDFERGVLTDEKRRNANGNKKGSNAEDASAVLSQGIGEKHLFFEISKRFPRIQNHSPTLNCLVGVKWDFYGIVKDRGEIE